MHTRWGVHLASQMGVFNPGYQWGLCHRLRLIRNERELNGRDSNRHLIKNSQGASRANPPFPSLPGPEFPPLFSALTLLPHKAQNYFLQLLFSLSVVCFQGSECGLRREEDINLRSSLHSHFISYLNLLCLLRIPTEEGLDKEKAT